MTFKEDLLTDLDDVFFNNDDFSVDVTYKLATIQGIFDNEFFESVDDSVGVETTAPKVIVKSSDVVGAVHGETMTINTIDYKIIGIQPDGTGITEILLGL